MRIAVIGTGIMGAPIARNLASAGHEVAAWNRTRAKAEEVAGVRVADTPADCVRRADAIVTMLSEGSAVREVMSADVLEAFSDEAIWLQMSTVGIAATEDLAAVARDAGVAFVDCPVLGTKKPAEEAKLVVLAAGPAEARERADQVFEAIGQKTVWLGEEPGAGTRMKLVINNWVLGITELLAESFALADALGVDKAKVLEILDGNPVGSPYAQVKGKLMIDETFEPSFPLRLAAKDARLVLDAAGERVRLPVTEATAAQMERAAELGHADEDMAATYYGSRNGGAHAT
jgi:3-hydroxyisobutyrate dehydrogenase